MRVSPFMSVTEASWALDFLVTSLRSYRSLVYRFFLTIGSGRDAAVKGIMLSRVKFLCALNCQASIWLWYQCGPAWFIEKQTYRGQDCRICFSVQYVSQAIKMFPAHNNLFNFFSRSRYHPCIQVSVTYYMLNDTKCLNWIAIHSY